MALTGTGTTHTCNWTKDRVFGHECQETAEFDNRRGKSFSSDHSYFLKEAPDDAVSPAGGEMSWRFDNREVEIASEKVRK